MTMFGSTIQALQQSMEYATVKNKTISNNIANVDTPNYKSKEVEFKNVLHQEMSSFNAKRTHSKHIPFQSSTFQDSSFSIRTNKSTEYNHNGNNVDIDKEMSELAKNQIYYQSLVDRLNGKFRSLETVIKGGR